MHMCIYKGMLKGRPLDGLPINCDEQIHRSIQKILLEFRTLN